MPVLVIAPFTEEYNRCISKELKDSIAELTADVSKDLRLVDFNELHQLAPLDFLGVVAPGS